MLDYLLYVLAMFHITKFKKGKKKTMKEKKSRYLYSNTAQDSDFKTQNSEIQI